MASLAVSHLPEHVQCGSSAPWYLLKSKPCQEARAQETIERIGDDLQIPVDVLLPMWTTPRDKERRPLFPGYLFASFPLELFSKINNAYGVRQIVRFGAMPAVVSERVIADIRRYSPEEPFLRPTPKYQPGDKIKVIEGPMRGFYGVFDYSLSDGERVRILLDTVGRLPVEVGKHDLMLI